MSDAYDENLGLTDSDCNVGEEGIYNSKSHIETRVFSSPVRSTRRAIVFVIPRKFNVQFMPPTGYRHLCTGNIFTKINVKCDRDKSVMLFE